MTADLQIGIGYALLAGTLWGIGPLLIKRGLKHSNVSTATLIEQTISVLCLFSLAVYHGQLFRPELTPVAFWSFFAAGAVGASFGKIFYNKSIETVGASKATSIKNSSPILTVLIAAAVLGEKLNLVIAGGVLLIVGGIAVLTRTPARSSRGPGRLSYFFYPLMAASFFGFNPVFKKIGVNSASLPILGALITQVAALAVMLTAGRWLNIKPRWEPVPLKSVLLFAICGITESLGSLSTFFALVHAPAVLVSPIWRVSPLITFALARFTLKGIEIVTIKDGVAAGLIVAGIFILARG